MATYNKYAERFSQKQAYSGKQVTSQQQQQLASDKEAYIQYLQNKIQQLSGFIVYNKNLDEKVNDFQLVITEHEQQFDNITKLIKLLQTFAEAQQQQNSTVRNTLVKQVNGSIQRLEHDTIRNLSENIVQIEKKVEGLVSSVDDAYHNMNEIERNTKKVLVNQEQKLDKNFEKLSKQLSGDIRTIESRTTQTGFNSQIQGFFEEVRDEVNRKIQLVMNEVQKSALENDLQEVQKTLIRESKERAKLAHRVEELSGRPKEDQTRHSSAQKQKSARKERDEPYFGGVLGSGSRGTTGHSDEQTRRLFEESGQLRGIVQKAILKIEQLETELQTNEGNFIHRDEFLQLEKNLIAQLSTAIDRFGSLMQNYLNLGENNRSFGAAEKDQGFPVRDQQPPINIASSQTFSHSQHNINLDHYLPPNGAQNKNTINQNDHKSSSQTDFNSADNGVLQMSGPKHGVYGKRGEIGSSVNDLRSGGQVETENKYESFGGQQSNPFLRNLRDDFEREFSPVKEDSEQKINQESRQLNSRGAGRIEESFGKRKSSDVVSQSHQFPVNSEQNLQNYKSDDQIDIRELKDQIGQMNHRIEKAIIAAEQSLDQVPEQEKTGGSEIKKSVKKRVLVKEQQRHPDRGRNSSTKAPSSIKFRSISNSQSFDTSNSTSPVNKQKPVKKSRSQSRSISATPLAKESQFTQRKLTSPSAIYHTNNAEDQHVNRLAQQKKLQERKIKELLKQRREKVGQQAATTHQMPSNQLNQLKK